MSNVLQSKWMIRAYTLSIDSKAIAGKQLKERDLFYCGNFENEKYGNRDKDYLSVFQGMYGGPDVMQWKIFKDQQQSRWNLSGEKRFQIYLEVRLFLDGNKHACFFRETYIIKQPANIKKNYVVVVGTSLDFAKLDTKMSHYDVKSIDIDEDPHAKKERYTIEDLFIEKLEKPGIFVVCYHKHAYEEFLIGRRYIEPKLRRIPFGNKTVREFIHFFTETYGYEWTVQDGVLHIGKELRAIRQYDCTPNVNRDDEFEATGVKIGGYMGRVVRINEPVCVLAHINQTWRCLWVSIGIGASSYTKSFWSKIGSGSVPIETYSDSLGMNNYVSHIFNNRLSVKKTDITDSNIISTGTLFNVSPEDTREKEDKKPIIEVDGIDHEEIPTTDPTNSFLGIGESGPGAYNVSNTIKFSHISPYLEDLAGIYFPVPTPPSTRDQRLCLGMSSIGRSNILGYFVNHDECKQDEIPKVGRQSTRMILKNSKDFVLQMPRVIDAYNGQKVPLFGPTLFMDGYYGKILLQCQGINPRVGEIDKNIPLFNEAEGVPGGKTTYGDGKGMLFPKEKNKILRNFFPYPKNVETTDFKITTDDEIGNPLTDEEKKELADEEADIEKLTQLNPAGQDGTYLYMRPRYTEAKNSPYNQVSLNAGGLKFHMRDDKSKENGIRMWIYRGDFKPSGERNRDEGITKVKFLKTKVEVQMGKTLKSPETVFTIKENSVKIKIGETDTTPPDTLTFSKGNFEIEIDGSTLIFDGKTLEAEIGASKMVFDENGLNIT